MTRRLSDGDARGTALAVEGAGTAGRVYVLAMRAMGKLLLATLLCERFLGL